MKYDLDRESVERNKAIVLKTYLPQKYKLSLLDWHLGKIMGVPNRVDIGHGALIEYHLREQNGFYFMHGINIIDLPFALAKEDILFVHHVLELCYFFVPLGGEVPRLFDLIMILYDASNALIHDNAKKLFLFKLFSCLGLYPEDPKFRTPYFHQLAGSSIDMITIQPLDLVIEQALDEWLLSCIALHPCTHNFKTVHFLHKNRMV